MKRLPCLFVLVLVAGSLSSCMPSATTSSAGPAGARGPSSPNRFGYQGPGTPTRSYGREPYTGILVEPPSTTTKVTIPNSTVSTLPPLSGSVGMTGSGTVSPPASSSASTATTSPSTSTTTPTSTTTTTPPPAADSQGYQYGIPVAGKPGFVRSPYTSPDAGLVDVRGFPPGTQVKDPYTGGIFLVP